MSQRFVRDALGLAVSQYLARGILLARGLLAAVALGPAGFGQWNALNLILDYGGYASSGALQGLDLRLPAPTARGEAGEARRLLAGAWTMVLAGGTLLALAVIAALALGRPTMLRGLGWSAPLMMLAAALLQLGLQYHGSALRARGRFGAVSGSAAAQALLGGSLGLALVWRFGIHGLLWGWLAGTLVALAWVRLAASDVPLRPGAPAEGIRLARSGFVVFAFFAVSLVLRSVDRLALIHHGTSADLGAYSLGLMAAGLVLYVPEAAAAVLYPRIAAAAGDTRGLESIRGQVARAHRALAVLLPLAAGVAMVWVAPALSWWLPRYRDSAGAVRLLVLGALLLSAATLPGYWLLGRARARPLLLAGLPSAVVTALLVFAVAARAPRPLPVACAACVGYGMFAVAIAMLAARDLRPGPGGRLEFAMSSFLPAAWAAVIAFVACRVGPAESVLAAGTRTAAVGLAYAPVLWWLGRGLGLRSLARQWVGREVRA
jgi:O-antigen/teichoic acid export membrane protein